MKPTEAPGFNQVLDELRSAKDDRPRYLVAGWHELAIDRCLSLFNEAEATAASLMDMAGYLFVVEGQVLRSTAPGFAGERWAHVCHLKWEVAHTIMTRIERLSGNLDIARLANDTELCSRYKIRKPDRRLDVSPPVVLLANVFEKRSRVSSNTILLTVFEAQS